MNAAEALDYITARLQIDSDPTLTVAEVVGLLPIAAVIDDDDLLPDDVDWTPTYSTTGCYRAIAEGWLLKRGKAIGRFDFSTDGQLFKRSQTLDQIDHQRRLYARKVQCSPSTVES